MAYITALGTATPPHKLSQPAIAAFMTQAMKLNEEEAHKLQVLFRASGIETRHSVLEDYGRTNGYTFFENSPSMDPFPSTRRRIELYRRHALSVSMDAVSSCLSGLPHFRKDSLTHLIVVSCTGMYAPGLDIDLVKALGLNSSIERTCINFMGCYAAFNALKLAHVICHADQKFKVLIVCTELCSIHFQRENTTDNMLANSLFADGSAAVVIESIPHPEKSLFMESFHCELATEGEHDMAWTIGDLGFEMRLSSYVPDVIRSGIRKLTRSLMSKIECEHPSIDFYAIHPGGRRILEAIETELNITKEDNRYAYDVLKRFGNMSSPTVLFVLFEIWKNLTSEDDGKRILSFAFGPGLTLESMVLQTAPMPIS